MQALKVGAGHLRNLWHVFRYFVKSATAFREKLILEVVVTLFRVVVLLLVYLNVYKIAPQAENVLPFEATMWSLAAYFVVIAFNVRVIYAEMNRLVKTGDIEMYVTRPFNLLAFVFARVLGSNFVMSSITLLSLVGFMLIFVGLPLHCLTLVYVVEVVVLLLGSVMIEGLIAAQVGLLAIWMENSKPLYRIVDKFVMILGGSYAPVAFFPEILQVISKYSPFGAARFFSYAFYPNFDSNALTYMIVQLFWGSVLTMSVYLTFKKGMKSLFINGS